MDLTCNFFWEKEFTFRTAYRSLFFVNGRGPNSAIGESTELPSNQMNALRTRMNLNHLKWQSHIVTIGGKQGSLHPVLKVMVVANSQNGCGWSPVAVSCCIFFLLYFLSSACQKRFPSAKNSIQNLDSFYFLLYKINIVLPS